MEKSTEEPSPTFGKALPSVPEKKMNLFGLLTSSSDDARPPQRKREVYMYKPQQSSQAQEKFAGSTQPFTNFSQEITSGQRFPEHEHSQDSSQPWLHAEKPVRQHNEPADEPHPSTSATLPQAVPVPPSHAPPSYSDATDQHGTATIQVAGYTVNKAAQKLPDM